MTEKQGTAAPEPTTSRPDFGRPIDLQDEPGRAKPGSVPRPDEEQPQPLIERPD